MDITLGNDELLKIPNQLLLVTEIMSQRLQSTTLYIQFIQVKASRTQLYQALGVYVATNIVSSVNKVFDYRAVDVRFPLM